MEILTLEILCDNPNCIFIVCIAGLIPNSWLVFHNIQVMQNRINLS